MNGTFRRFLAATALAGAAAAAAQGLPAAPACPRVEVAFVLDSTGSMGGLIEGAKQKIWSIANAIIAPRPDSSRPGAERPAPQVRIGLIAYRDRGTASTRRWPRSSAPSWSAGCRRPGAGPGARTGTSSAPWLPFPRRRGIAPARAEALAFFPECWQAIHRQPM
jgi:hypothetical protein